jgi:hypothetical protein
MLLRVTQESASAEFCCEIVGEEVYVINPNLPTQADSAISEGQNHYGRNHSVDRDVAK